MRKSEIETIEVGKVYAGKKPSQARTVEGIRLMGGVYASGPKIWCASLSYAYDIHYRSERGLRRSCSINTFLTWAKCEVPPAEAP